MQNDASAPRADEHLGSHADRCLCTGIRRASLLICRAVSLHRELTSISIHMQNAVLHREVASISAHIQSDVSAPRADERLDSHAERCLCTEI
jgi:hypothetical protein